MSSRSSSSSSSSNNKQRAAAAATAASAGSYAAAAPGSSSSVTSGALATEPGASAAVVAVGVAPSGGQRVVVDCRLAAARPGHELARYCEGVPSSNSGNPHNNNSGDDEQQEEDEEVRRWREAPTCGKEAARGAQTVALDAAGRAWSREPDAPEGRLCAFRDEVVEGMPFEQPPPAGEEAGEDTWEGAPECWGDPTVEFLTRDYAGRAWGWQDGASCAWRNVKREEGEGAAAGR